MKFRVPEIVLGALLTLAVLSIGLVIGSQQPPPQHGQQPSGAYSSESIVASTLTDPQTKENYRSSQQEKRWYHTFTQHTPEWLIAIFTGTLWWSTRRLWRVTNDTLRHAEQTAERQLRAYVLKDTGDIGLQGDEKQKVILVNVSFKNFGQTPGYDLNAWTHCKIADADKPPFDDVVGNNQRSVIGPGGEYQTRSDPIWVSAADLAAIRLQTKVIFVWGKVTYRDAFGQNWVFTFRGRNTELMHKRDDSDWVGWGIAAHPGSGDEETKG